MCSPLTGHCGDVIAVGQRALPASAGGRQPTSSATRRVSRSPLQAAAPTAALDLHQTVQNALADLLSIAGLQHEDSWDASSAHPGATSALPQLRGGSERPGPGPAASAAGSSTRAPSFRALSMGPAGGAVAGEAEEEEEEEEVVQEQDLPPAAAARLYQARLRAAQGELESLQAAVKGRDARLSGLKKEVQALRQARPPVCRAARRTHLPQAGHAAQCQ